MIYKTNDFYAIIIIKMSHDLCISCKVPVLENDPAVSCDSCGKWHQNANWTFKWTLSVSTFFIFQCAIIFTQLVILYTNFSWIKSKTSEWPD